MVEPSIRAALQAIRRSKLLGRLSPAIVLFAVLAVAGSLPIDAQQSAQPRAGEPAGKERIIRLQDSLDARKDWEIGVPLIEPDVSTDSSFAGLIRAGRALGSEAYLNLDSELRQVQQQRQARPEDEAVRQRLEALQDTLVERIEINIDFDYLYAAAVYIELYRQAEGSEALVRQYSRKLGERRSAQAD